MGLLEINRHPSARELRRFGVLLAVFVALAGGLAHWRLEAPAAARTVWMVGAGLAGVYAAAPPLRRWIWLGWLYAAFPIGWTLSHLALAAAYYLVLAPIGLLLRLFPRRPAGAGPGPIRGELLDRAPARARRSALLPAVLGARGETPRGTVSGEAPAWAVEPEMADGESSAGGHGRGRDFEADAEAARPGLVAELWEFMATNKKWWLTPIVIVLLLVGALVLMSGTVAAPFIYTLF